MYAVESASTASERACAPAPAAPSFGAAGGRAAGVSPPSGRPFASLRTRSDLRRVRRNGTRRRSGGVTVFVAPGAPGRPRMAFVAGRRVGTAVRRNRAKRRLRAAAARADPAGGRDYIVVAGPSVLVAPFGELVGWLSAAVE